MGSICVSESLLFRLWAISVALEMYLTETDKTLVGSFRWHWVLSNFVAILARRLAKKKALENISSFLHEWPNWKLKSIEFNGFTKGGRKSHSMVTSLVSFLYLNYLYLSCKQHFFPDSKVDSPLFTAFYYCKQLIVILVLFLFDFLNLFIEVTTVVGLVLINNYVNIQLTQSWETFQWISEST